ncbi:MAG TPA: RHS repeat-associated core domain-containing protein, partial [Desulfitobacteriaceae bacterium]|nr:RHS repeat-associated core domain-containing protein [Desulfitobacteriaceae bacterium]
QIWDGQNIVLELDGAGEVINKYLRGINLIFSEDSQGAQEYYLFNGHGDVVQLTGTDGNVSKSYDYDAFGVEKNPDANDTNPFRYSGEYLDSETNTYYLRARNYDPTTGRFLSEDTNTGKATDPLSLNLYTYCSNNPIRYIDTTGNAPEDVTRQLARWIIANPAAVWVTQNPGWAGEKLFSAAGFDRDSDRIYHARQDALQQYGGYNFIYDIVFDYATSMKPAISQFAYNGQDYRFWAWKGDYLNLGAGAELGLYSRLSVLGNQTDHWLADTSSKLTMTLALRDNKGNPIANYNPSAPQWWITAFNPYYQSVQAGNLTATYTVNFENDTGMYNAFINSDAFKGDKRWSISPNDKNTLIFNF